MAGSVKLAIANLERAKEDLRKHEARDVPDWYIAMFRVEVECCAAELQALTRR